MTTMIDAESAVLGAILLDPQAYWKIAGFLREDDFETGQHADLFAAVAGLIRAGDASDAVTVGERFPALATLAVTLAASDGWRQANVSAYAESVASRATARRVKLAGQRIAKIDQRDAYAEAQRILATCQPRASEDAKPLKHHLRAAYETIIEIMHKPQAGTVTGVSTSLPELDTMTAGLQPGSLNILAARPSVGKSALAIQIMHAAASAGTPVFFASLEMTGVEVVNRLLSLQERIDSSLLRNPHLIRDEAVWSRITRGNQTMIDWPLFIDATPAMTLESVNAKARQLDATKRLGLVVIDYLTSMTPPRANTMAEAWQIVTRGLKAMAKELNVPVLLLSQLNREGAEKPRLQHLRDSGAIEQDADTVIFLHRPNENDRDHVTLTVAKQRNGPTGEVYLLADMAHSRFVETEAPAPAMEDRAPSRGFGRASTASRWRAGE